MLNLKEIASTIKGSILFHKKGLWDKSRADEMSCQLDVVTESVLRQSILLNQHNDTIDLILKRISSLEVESKPIIPTITITETPKALKLKAPTEIIKEQDTELTHRELREIFEYRDGDLYWKISPTTNVKVGDKAGHKSYKKSARKSRYIVTYKGTPYYASKIIFMMFYGWLPEIVDCIDGDYSNTKIENLRGFNGYQSLYRCRKSSNNPSGYKGVFPAGKKWAARITRHKKNLYLGTFDNPIKAHKAYCRAAKKLHGEFTNYG